jgi:hypothetical protein
MVTTTKARRKAVKRPPRETWRVSIPGVRMATEEEGQRLFDRQARRTLGISGEEFLERWDSGAYRDVTDPHEANKVRRVAMLIPSVRRTRAPRT